MKKFFLAFLVCVMFVPGLACAMPCCPPASHEAQSDTHSHRPCDEHEGHGKQSHGVMFSKDCAKVSLQSVSGGFEKNPDVSFTNHFVFIKAEAPAYNLHAATVRTARGPPFDWPAPSATRPSILLTTLRFRQ